MNRHPIAAFAAAAVVCLLSVNFSAREPTLGVAAARAADDPEACLRFEHTQSGKTIDFEAKSACEQRLDCSLEWSVRCADRNGKTTSKTRERKRFSVDAGKSESIAMSAESCEQAWTIDDVTWSCRSHSPR